MALFLIDNVSFEKISYGYCNAFSIGPQIILYNFYLIVRHLPSIRKSFFWRQLRGKLSSFFVCLTLVLTVNNLSHVSAATITYFQLIFVENFVQFVFFREMFFYQF